MKLENKEWKQEKVKKMKAISLWTFAKSELIRKMDISWQNQSEEPACSSTGDPPIPPFWSTLIFYLFSFSWLAVYHMNEEGETFNTPPARVAENFYLTDLFSSRLFSEVHAASLTLINPKGHCLLLPLPAGTDPQDWVTGLVTNPIAFIYKSQCLLHQIDNILGTDWLE